MPKKPESSEGRYKIMNARVLASEHATFTEAAAKDGMALSKWLRWLAENRVIAQGKLPRKR